MKIIAVFLLFLSIANSAYGLNADVYAWKIVIKKEAVPSSYSFTEKHDRYDSSTSYGGEADTYVSSISTYIKLSNAVFTDEDTGTETNVSFNLQGTGSVNPSRRIAVNKFDYICADTPTQGYWFLVVKLKQPVIELNQNTIIPVQVYCHESSFPYL